MQKITTFLMFDGKAEEAMNFYTSIFKESTILNVVRYEKDEQGIEGKIKHASFTLNNQQFMCMDSSGHNFNFTPSTSLFIVCNSEEEIDELFKQLSPNGQVMMPLDAYPFGKKYAWVSDRFGVSWQLMYN